MNCETCNAPGADILGEVTLCEECLRRLIRSTLRCDGCGKKVPLGDNTLCSDCYFHSTMDGRDDDPHFIEQFIDYLQRRLADVRASGRIMN